MNKTIHTYPRMDIKEHATEGDECWCRPETKEVFHSNGVLAGWIVVHNSSDGREQYETGQRSKN